MDRQIVVITTGKPTGIVAYGYMGERKVYKIVKLEDGYKVEHKDPNTHYRNRIKRYPNAGWHFNTCQICDTYDVAENFVLNDRST